MSEEMIPDLTDERARSYERAILIDARVNQYLETERIAGCSALHTTSAHDTSLQNSLTLGRSKGADLPANVTIVGIATNPVYDFGEELSLPVSQAISQATRIVIDLL